ncbi:MAG: T9SS type A sorting domain-containing protein [Candidatus Marinimicrobia bacterium]|nr:T9SS type A sorting domain-containing protein [Candidatus Neomarinimicrobiota bacterium]MBL7112887.1 T9SS type A sorting domain-containing protein [Bacteroidales bacterium]
MNRFISIVKNSLYSLATFGVVTLLSTSSTAQVLPEYHNFATDFTKTVNLNYLLYIPPDYVPSEAWPLILFLTGQEAVDDINLIRDFGLPHAVETGMNFDYFIVAPQLPEGTHWDPDALMALTNEVINSYHIDNSFLHMTGIGDIGGWGAWETAVSYPSTFSKIAPMGAPACTEICRVGDPSIWIFHGELDDRVPVEDAENMYYELDYYCSNDNLQLTVYDSLGHNVWDQAYLEDGFLQWLTGSEPTYGTNTAQPQILNFTADITKPIDDDYLLYFPVDYGQTEHDWPLVIFLHGAGSAITNIDDIRVTGPPWLFEHGMDSDFILLCPQLYADVHWDPDRLYALMQEVISQYSVDQSRIYLTGLSRGGFGTWEFGVSYPNLFAALVPIAARDVPGVERLINSNIWIFHGALDNGVPWQGAQFMYNRLSGVDANVQLTLFAGVGHNSWDPAYNTDSLWTWLLLQQIDVVAVGENELVSFQDSSLKNNYPNPANPGTIIEWTISDTDNGKHVKLEIFDILGKSVRSLINKEQYSGNYTVNWDGRNDAGLTVPAGAYIYRLQVDGEIIDSRKILLVK